MRGVPEAGGWMRRCSKSSNKFILFSLTRTPSRSPVTLHHFVPSKKFHTHPSCSKRNRFSFPTYSFRSFRYTGTATKSHAFGSAHTKILPAQPHCRPLTACTHPQAPPGKKERLPPYHHFPPYTFPRSFPQQFLIALLPKKSYPQEIFLSFYLPYFHLPYFPVNPYGKRMIIRQDSL